MIVQFVLKGLFFYFLFLFVRSFFKGMKEGESGQASQTFHGQAKGHHRNKAHSKKKSSADDVVEADFRRL